MSDLKSLEELRNEVDKASWSMLEEHHKRGALFIVENGLDLVEVGNAFSRDYSSVVKIWLDNKELKKVDDIIAEDLAKSPLELNVSFLIISPYVLIQKNIN